jgi:hypothetical protein
VGHGGKDILILSFRGAVGVVQGAHDLVDDEVTSAASGRG